MTDTSTQGGFIVPAGDNVYSGLQSAFVKMDGLLAYLNEEKFNGYVLLHREEFGAGVDGLLLFRDGAVAGASYGEALGEDAQAKIGERVAYQAGKMDIVALEPTTVEALEGSFGPQSPYTDLRTAFVNVGNLVSYLEGQGFTGSVTVSGREGRAAVLLADGKLVGAYGDQSRGLEQDLSVANGIGADGEGSIRVSSVVR